jgi:hypothetical protein
VGTAHQLFAWFIVMGVFIKYTTGGNAAVEVTTDAGFTFLLIRCSHSADVKPPFFCRAFQLHRMQVQCAEWILLHGVTVIIKNNCARYAFFSCSQVVAARVSQTDGRVPDFCEHGTATDTTRLKTTAL